MHFDDFDKFVTDTLNEVIEQSNGVKAQILAGQLEPHEYKSQTGYLRGLDEAADILKQKANEYYKTAFEQGD